MPGHLADRRATKPTCSDLSVGDEAIFEVAYGTEKVVSIMEMWVGNQALRGFDGEIIGEPSAGKTSTPWIMLKFGLVGPGYGPRYVVRFTHEPITIVEAS